MARSNLVEATAQGTQHGKWTVIGPADKPGDAAVHLHVRCACGNERTVRRSRLLSKLTQSCGCDRGRSKRGTTWDTDQLASAHAPAVTLGAQFGRLTVTSRRRPSHKRHTETCPPDCDIPLSSEATVRCLCECGNERIVPTRRLANRTTRSCGCLKRDAGRALHA